MKDRKWWNSVPAWWRSPPPTPPPPPPIPPPENLPELPEGLTPDVVLGVKTRHSLDLTDLPPVRASVPRARSTPPRRRKEGVEGLPDISFSFFNEQAAPVDMEVGTTVVLGEHSTLVVSKKSPNISCINILSVNTKQQSENTYASPSSPSSSISISPNTLDTVSSSSVVISPNQPDISTSTHSTVSVNLNQSDIITPISSSILISQGQLHTTSTRNCLSISPIHRDRDSAVSTTPNQGVTISNVLPKAADKTIPRTSFTLPSSSQQLPPNKYKPLTLPRSSVFLIGNEPVTTNNLPDTSFISPPVSTTAESSPNTPTTPTFSTNGDPPTSVAVESPPTTPNSSTTTFVSTTANPPSYTNSAMEERAKIDLSTSPIVSSTSVSRITTQESAPSTPTSPTPTCTSIDANPSNKSTSPGDSPPTTPTSPTSAVSTDVNPPSSAPTPPSESPPTTPTEPIPITSTPIESHVNTKKTDSVNADIGSCPTTPTTPTNPVVSAFPDTSPSSPCSLDSPRAALTISLPLELSSCPDWETITEYSEYYYGKREHGSDYEDVETRQEYCEHRAEDPRQRRATLMRDRRLGRVRTRIRRAWRAVRGWWSDERLRIGDAIQRHAHAQAVKQDDEEKTVVVRRRNAPRQDNSRPSSRAGARRSRHIPEGQNGFEELRRYIKQGGDFCKDLSSILQERSEAETQYAKSLSKLSGKLLKASKDSVGTVTQAWQRAGTQMETQSEIHRAFATALSEEVVKPLRQLVEAQHRIRKSVESAVDKTGKSLGEWRAAESKSKKQSFVSARENEKLQDAMLDVRLGRASSTTHLHVTGIGQNHSKDKESAKLESKRRKAEEAVKKADVEYYTFSLRAERARLEWETAVIRGSHCFQALEEERLQQLKDLAACYLHHLQEMGPKMVQGVERLREPVESCDVARDIQTVVSIKGTGQPIPEQLLPDFYAEHITLAMNRDRRRQALVKLLQLIRQDLDRERRGKQGVENLARALQQTPTFGAEDSQQNVTEKLHHMRSMLTYLEAMRYKVQSALAELDGRTRGGHPLAGHIQVTRDRQGLQQSVLKVPPWVREESLDRLAGDSPDWTDRGTADGNSVQPDSDFERVCADEFSSQGSEKDYQSSVLTQCPVISECASETAAPPPDAAPSIGQCRALYEYTANLYDELNLQPGDVIKIHDKQADGWWLGELNGVVGIFPATYVQEID